MEQLRLFIAVELNDALRGELKRAQTQLQNELGGKIVRWVAPHNIHLTLKFLGNCARAQIPHLTDALARAANHCAPFVLVARGLGCFPNARRPNVIWVGLDGEIQAAALLAQTIEAECARLDFARDARGLTPHLTLGRVRRETSLVERAALGAHIAQFPPTLLGEIRANAVHLIASDLKPSGPVYSILASQELTTQ